MKSFESIDVALDYLRAHWLRLRGGKLSPKVRIGAGCKMHRVVAITLGERCTFEAAVVLKLVEAGSRFVAGNNVFVGRGSQFDISGQIEIGEGTLIAPGCFITDHNHGISPAMPIWQQACEQKQVRIGADVWLGAGVIVLPGVTIGDGAVVAAGAVVAKDVAPMSIVAGVPARFVRARN